MSRRIFAFMLVAVLVTASVTVLSGALLTRPRLAQQVDRNFKRQADALVTVIDRSAGRSPVYLLTARRLVLLPAGGTSDDAVLARQLRGASRQRDHGTIDTPRGEIRFLTRTTTHGAVVLGRFARLTPREEAPLTGSLLIAGLAGALIAAIASLALSRRLARPIERIVRATSEISEGRAGVKVNSTSGDELGRLVEAFNAMADGLDAARVREREFVMSVSHDLRTPLTGIRGYAEALREEAVDPATAADAIHDEARHLERLVEDLLDIARIGRHDFTAHRDLVDLAEVVHEAARRHGAVADELGVTLETAVRGGVTVVADRDRVLQATSNLVENALRLTPAGGTVRITARDHGVEVADTGPGLAPADVPRALDRYHLHRKYRSTRSVGTGLGLAIVQELARAMRGRVEVRSTPGQGAVFSLELPAASDGLVEN
jgi:two-component system OmpR family sensor kinase